MSVASSSISVGTTATLLATGLNGPSWVYLHAPTGGNTIYVGTSAVTTTTGLELPKGALNTFWVAETDKLYGIVATGTQSVMVLQTGGR